MVKAYSTTAVSGGTVAGAGSFDIGIKRTSGTVVGMMLRHDKNDVPSYAVYDRKNLADQFFTGVPSQSYQDPEEELPIIMDSWRSGFGLEVYDSSDPERYRASNGMDMRFRGMMIAGPIATAVNPYSTVTAARVRFNRTNPGVAGFNEFSFRKQSDQSWNSPTSTTDTGAGWTNDANVYDGNTGTYAETPSASGWTEYLELNIASITIDAVRYWSSGAQLTEIDIDLYYGGAWNHYYHRVVGSSGAWVTIAPSGTTVAHADFNSQHYISIGASLAKLNSAGTGFNVINTLPATITALEVFGSNLFIALGTSTDYQYMSTAEAFTIATSTVKRFKYFKTVDAATPVLWGSDSDNTIRSSVTGTADDWSGTTTIASSWDEITGLFSDSGLLYVNKEDMPYYLNSTGAVKNDLAPEMATFARSTDNGKGANWWLHNFYMPWGSSLLEEDGGVLTWRSPNDYSTQLADFVGQVFAVAGDDHYLFAIIDYTTKIEVLACRKETIGSTTKWVIHPICEITLTGCEACWVSAVYQKRLWISSTSSSDSIYYIPLPVAYGNVLADANRSFLTGVTMETPWLHGGFRSETKAFIKETLEMGHTYDADIYFTTKYKLLEDTAWTTVGNYTGSSSSMIQSRYIPVDSGSNNPTSTLYKTQITAVTDDTTKTPVLLSYTLRAVLYPTKGTIIACKVRCAKEITLRDGGLDLESDATIIATLNEARTATYPITIYDINGDVQTVKLLSLPAGVPYWIPIKNEASRVMEREYNILMQVIPVS